MYKQSFEVQGATSDMFIRTNRGFTYDTFEPLNDLVVTNISAQSYKVVTDPNAYVVTWDETNLDDYTYENDLENTFSPRIFLRGNNIYTGFEYTPDDNLTQRASMPSNFHTNLYIEGTWEGPKNITQVVEANTTTVDARFFSTPKGSFDETGLASDLSNPDVLFVTWGTLEGPKDDRAEGDIFFVRSTDVGETWEAEQNLSSLNKTIIQEKEVESFASPDGKTIYNTWLQESETEPTGAEDENLFFGLDSWFGRVDYNVTAP